MRTFLMLAVLFTVPALCFAQTTWYVPDDFPTIQGAITTTANGDTVIVRPGTYVENIDFLGKAITVESEGGKHVTVIDGGQQGSVVTFKNSEGIDSVLQGFTLMNGLADYGAGILCDEFTSPKVMQNTIAGNEAAFFGGGIYCEAASHPKIEQNTIHGNLSTHGGGISCSTSSPYVYRNNIIGNEARGSGGGIHYSFTAGTIKENTIAENCADFAGGGIYFLSSTPNVARNLILDNSAEWGGGMYCYYNSSPAIGNNELRDNSAEVGGGLYLRTSNPTLENNTITSNTATIRGGGLYSGESSLSILNSIFWNNTAPEGPEIVCGGGTILTLGYCDLKGGQASVYEDPYSLLHWTAGMIDADPHFVDPGINDFHIKYTSPCRNAGFNPAAYDMWDFESDVRIADGTVDMGMDEFHLHVYHTGDPTPGGSMELKFIGKPGALINGLFLGNQLLWPPVMTNIGAWWLDHPFQTITGFGTIPADGVRIFSGTVPSLPPGPYTVHMQAAINFVLTVPSTVTIQP